MKNLLLLAFIFNFMFANAQECGTPASTNNQTFPLASNLGLDGESTCVNVKIHILRETNGSGGYDASQIPSLITLLNQYYNPHSIRIMNVGIDYINNSNLLYNDDTQNNLTEFNQTIAINNEPNAINFYIVSSFFAYGVAQDVISKNILVRADRVLTSTSPHELGHCFNLDHTWRGTYSGSGGCAELINGSNCTSCGDFVCDTPADSRVGVANGYNPDMTNIMSYYNPRDHFTAQQGARMRNAINGSPVLTPVRSTQCSEITGLDRICLNTNYDYLVSNPNSSTVVWSVTPNLQIVSSNNSIAVIRSSTTGTSSTQETITANINGTIVTKNVSVGSITSVSINGPSAVCRGVSYIYYANVPGGHKPGYTYRWTMPLSNWYIFEQSDNRINAGPSGGVNGSGQLRVEVNNGCGWSPAGGLVVYPNPSCQFGYTYRVSPNPVNSTKSLTVEKISSDAIKSVEQTSKITATTDKNDFEIEIKDLSGKTKINRKLINDKSQVDVSSLQKGVYILLIYDQGETSQQKIIIN